MLSQIIQSERELLFDPTMYLYHRRESYLESHFHAQKTVTREGGECGAGIFYPSFLPSPLGGGGVERRPSEGPSGCAIFAKKKDPSRSQIRLDFFLQNIFKLCKFG